MTREPIESWELISSTYTFRDEWLTLRSDRVRLPDGSVLDPFHVVELPDAVNVVALSASGHILLVEQYRHVIGRRTIEIPAGQVDEGETPADACRRELLEETGYGGGQWHDLGSLFPFGSRLTNRTHSFLALDVRKLAEPKLDNSENIRLHEIPWDDFAASLRDGQRPILEGSQIGGLALLFMYVSSSTDPKLSRLRL
ncbi:MAG: NUDIX hydrolase [bacterium]|nr:NUDIX hydrolase [bacterium]